MCVCVLCGRSQAHAKSTSHHHVLPVINFTSFTHAPPVQTNAIRSEGYEGVLASTHIALHQMLERKLFDQPAPLNITVTGRLKEKYSLWRKMARKRREGGGAGSVSLDDITDVVAMRIVINLERQPHEPESEFKARGIYLCYRILVRPPATGSDNHVLGWAYHR